MNVYIIPVFESDFRVCPSSDSVSYSKWMAAVVRNMYPMASRRVSVVESEENLFLECATSFAMKLPWSLNQRDLVVWILHARISRMTAKNPVDHTVLACFAQSLMSLGQGYPGGKLSAERLPYVVQNKNRKYDLGYLLPCPGSEVVPLVNMALERLIMSAEDAPILFSEGSLLENVIDNTIWKPVLIKGMTIKSQNGEETHWADQYISLGE